MSALISLAFPCAVCGYEIRGEYEAEDFDYPVFCPKCGRQNPLPALTANADSLSTPIEAERETPPEIPLPKPPASRQPSRVAWRFHPGKTSRPVSPLRNCVAVDEQGRVICALGSELVALVPGETGCEVAWKYATADRIPGAPVIGPGGSIYVHSGDGLLHALDPNGSPLRVPTKVGPALGWATPLVDHLDQVWLCAATGGIMRVDPAGRTTSRPFFRHPHRFDCTGVLKGSALYLGCEDQFLHAIDLRGERGRDLWNLQNKVGLTGWYINSAIALAGEDRIIAVSRDDQMYAYNLQGVLEWNAPLNGRVLGSPVIAANGAVLVGVSSHQKIANRPAGRLTGIQSKSGQTIWSVELDAGVESTPVVGDADEIFFGDNSGAIHAINLQGERIWSESIGVAVRSAGSILPNGQVVFGLDDGSLIALRCSSHAVGAGWPKLLGTVANRSP